MKSWLLDVNVLLGYCWTNHADHTALFTWLTSVEEWATGPISELGFLRISMTLDIGLIAKPWAVGVAENPL